MKHLSPPWKRVQEENEQKLSKSKGHYSVENCSIVIKIVHDLEIILIIISICATSAKKNVWKLMVNGQIGRQINIVIILPYFAHLEV